MHALIENNTAVHVCDGAVVVPVFMEGFNPRMTSVPQAVAAIVRATVAVVVIVAIVALLLNSAPTAIARIGAFFNPTLSRVDRSIIGGCRNVLEGNETWAEMAAHLEALHCERYSDRQFMQIQRDVEKCAENASKGDAELNRCLAAAQGH